ncbi:endonuclease III [Niabella sp.]|uniref:endonuclease III domain-containing protein n=1 Tax=Niabella sp. TaxID=1962976 RepID=UPI0026284F55|nr:endonuclease III [Niabella sp.]
MSAPVNWPQAIQPLLKKYKATKHPLDYKNTYQLLVMVVLSAQDSDRHINQIAPAFFKNFPTMTALSKATEAAIAAQISDVRNFGNKAQWLSEIAQSLKRDAAIPLNLEALTELKGIGRKSANVILRESGKAPEGVIVDLHVVRVAPRLGIATGTDPKKIEKQIMDILPQKDWDAGMAMSFLGREICRPTNPKCEICLMNKVCKFYNGY